MALTQITLTGTLLRPDNTPAEATVLAALVTRMVYPAGPSIVGTEPVRGVLNASGQLKAADGASAFKLFAVDTAGAYPAGGVLMYRIVVQWASAKWWIFYIVIPASAPGGTIDLATLTLYDEPGAIAQFNSATSTNLIAWTLAEAFQVVLVTSYDATYPTIVKTANIKWPDGSAGVFTTDTINSTWKGIDAFHITHSGTGKTVTQTAVTRDASGNVTAQPTPTVA